MKMSDKFPSLLVRFPTLLTFLIRKKALPRRFLLTLLVLLILGQSYYVYRSLSRSSWLDKRKPARLSDMAPKQSIMPTYQMGRENNPLLPSLVIADHLFYAHLYLCSDLLLEFGTLLRSGKPDSLIHRLPACDTLSLEEQTLFLERPHLVSDRIYYVRPFSLYDQEEALVVKQGGRLVFLLPGSWTNETTVW